MRRYQEPGLGQTGDMLRVPGSHASLMPHVHIEKTQTLLCNHPGLAVDIGVRLCSPCYKPTARSTRLMLRLAVWCLHPQSAFHSSSQNLLAFL